MGVKSIMANEAVEMEPSGRVLPIFRGEYDAGRTYENPDIVLYRNSSYVAKQVTVGNPPPARRHLLGHCAYKRRIISSA